MRALCAATALLGVVACAHVGNDADEIVPKRTVELRLIALNDFHGNLEALYPDAKDRSGGDDEATLVGGAPHLASHIDGLRQSAKHALVVSAGDLIGASPLVSALFHDEPTIEVMNQIGLDLNGVGNHEFDEGLAELMRLRNGGCHPEEGCVDARGFEGAEFEFLAANVLHRDTGKPVFPPYSIRSFEGISVAFIGLTLESTPDMLPPVVPELRFRDEADTTNALVARLRAQGVRSIVVLLHEGGFPENLDPDTCAGLSGPLLEVVDRFDGEVDVVISGHTHQRYICRRDGRLITSAGSFGRWITRIDLELSPDTGDIVAFDAENIEVRHTVPSDKTVARSVRHYVEKAAPLSDRVVTSISAPLTRERTRHGLSMLGRVIADAQLAATRQPAGAELALMNAGGIRTAVAPVLDQDGLGKVTYGMLFAAQPFGNHLVTMSFRGRELADILAAQFDSHPPHFMEASSNVSYRWQTLGGSDHRIVRSSIRIGGEALEPGRTYRVTVNTFMASREPFSRGRERTSGPQDLEALVRYLAAQQPFEPNPLEGVERVRSSRKRAQNPSREASDSAPPARTSNRSRYFSTQLKPGLDASLPRGSHVGEARALHSSSP